MTHYILVMGKWFITGVLFISTFYLHDPLWLPLRDYQLAGILSLCLFQIGLTGGAPKFILAKPRCDFITRLRQGTKLEFRTPQNRSRRDRRLYVVINLLIVCLVLVNECTFQWKKYVVLHTESARLQQIGQHLIIGYRHPSELRPVLERGAIGGIFLTRRNVRRRTKSAIQQEIAGYQTIAARVQRPLLWVLADQEGGIVSHLSPPLTALPALASLVASQADSPTHLEQLVEAYARQHAEELRMIGVNVNLSPVVDLKLDIQQSFKDRYARIGQRAISADAAFVTQIALRYSQWLEQGGVIPTVKHFPGLGRIAADTQFHLGELDVSVAELRDQDWRPFREVLTHSSAFMMLGHVILRDVDPEFPVSCSKTVVQSIIREAWQHDGILITDDLTMHPIYRSPGGIGQAAAAALNAGIDLLLISYDGEQYYHAMHALIQAERKRQLDAAQLQKSQQRLEKARNSLKNSHL